MSSIPSNLARIPNTLVSQIILGTLNRTSRDLLYTQIQLATGKRVNRPSDDSVATSMITVLDDVIERREQRIRNFSHGEALLNNLDAALGDATNSVIEARGIALSQIGFGADAQTRSNQAKVIDAMLNEMVSIANRSYQGIHFFGGNRTNTPPITELLGGFRYRGEGAGIQTDFGLSRPVAITMSADQAFGALSSRVSGDRDLNPSMVLDTRLVDLNGARGFGINLSTINVDVGGTDVTVDLTKAHTVQDVITKLQAGIQTIDAGATVTIAASGNAFEISGTTLTVTISDLTAAAAAADLGLTGTYPAGGGTGQDVDPTLTFLSPVSSLSGVTVPLGTIRLTNAGQTRDVDLSAATTIQDIMNAVEGAGLGIRVEIAASGDRLAFVNEQSGGEMSIGEFGGGSTATQLGIRSLTGTTLLKDFNDGLGVEIISGSVDPISGLPDPARDIDFLITLQNGSTFNVDLSGDLTVQEVLDSINAAAGAAGLGGTGPGDTFYANLVPVGNGLQLLDNSAGAGSFSVTALNGSHAAENLGILGTAGGAILTGTDRAKVSSDSVFTHLIALRDALEANDNNGIEIAAGKLENDVLRITGARADVGVRSRRVEDSSLREEDLRIQDIGLRSNVQDLDYTEAVIRFSILQQQLQAGLMSASQVTSLSLLDFLR